MSSAAMRTTTSRMSLIDSVPRVVPVPNACSAVVLSTWIMTKLRVKVPAHNLSATTNGVNLSCVDVCVLRAEKGIRLFLRDEDLLPVRVGWTPFIIEAAEAEVGGVRPQMVCVPSGVVEKTSPCCQRERGFPPFQVGDRVTR